MKKFKEYCMPQKKHVMVALKFSQRRQGENKSFESFVIYLKILVKDCGYQKEDTWSVMRSFSVVNTQRFVK